MADQEAAVVDVAAPEENDPQAEAPIPGEEALGDPGKKALDAMKAERNAAKAEAKARADEIAALRARLEGREAEYAAEQERRNVEAAALAKANGRIVRSEVKAAAKGVLADPADALAFLDVEQFDVDDDGNVDEGAIAAAIADLVARKPHLAAAQGQQRFQGNADQGHRGKDAPSEQQQIEEALKVAKQRRDIPAQVALKNRLLAITSTN